MATDIHFTKMQGAGNDYIYVNTLQQPIHNPEALSLKLSDRHFGIGGDGLVLICKPTDGAKADFRMRIFNADGSEAMMCGNASRCIGKYVYERGLTDKTSVRLETLSGIKTLELHLSDRTDDRGRRRVESVTVDMLEPRFSVAEQYVGRKPELTPTLLPHVLKAADGEPQTLFVSMGNPHYVIFVDNVGAIDIAAEGARLEHDAAFPQRCNIEFAQPLADGSLRTRVWERGSGITLACGTGACATATAAASLGIRPRTTAVKMDGGELHIEWRQADGHVYMTGPAAFSFDGVVSI